MADVSTFSDFFPGPGIDPTKWEDPYADYDPPLASFGYVEANRLHFQPRDYPASEIRTLYFADPVWTWALNSSLRMRWERTVPEALAGWQVSINFTIGEDAPGWISVGAGHDGDDPDELHFSSAGGGEIGGTLGIPYDPVAHRYIKISRFSASGAPSRLYAYTSPDGTTWTYRWNSTFAIPNDVNDRAHWVVGGGWGNAGGWEDEGSPVKLGKVQGTATLTPPADPTGGGSPLLDPYDADPDPEPEVVPDSVDPDPFAPLANLPAQPEPGCATVLDLIREFSAAVKRAVRLTGTNTIQMVDPNGPLPTGWLIADGNTLYHAHSQELKAGAAVLSLKAGDLAMEGGADLVTNDVRLATSNWLLPGRLPVYGLNPALVQRVSYTFTPKTFSGSVEFVFPTVPLEVRRT